MIRDRQERGMVSDPVVIYVDRLFGNAKVAEDYFPHIRFVMSMKQCMVPCPVVLKANLEPGESRMCVHGNCVITVCHDESCFINLSTAHRVKDGIIVPRPAVPTEIGIRASWNATNWCGEIYV